MSVAQNGPCQWTSIILAMAMGIILHPRVCFRRAVLQQLLRHGFQVSRCDESAIDVPKFSRTAGTAGGFLLAGSGLFFVSVFFISLSENARGEEQQHQKAE